MTGAAALAAFLRRVTEDRALAERLRPIEAPEALVRAAVAEGERLGLRFAAADLEAVMDENRRGSLLHPSPVLLPLLVPPAERVP